MKHPNHYHWQKTSKFCVPYAFTHAIEQICKEQFPEYEPHLSPKTVVWKGLNAMGIVRFVSRSMSVSDLQKGVTESKPLFVALRKNKETKVAKINHFKLIREDFESLGRIRSLLDKGPVLVALWSAHKVCIVEATKDGFMVVDSQRIKPELEEMPNRWIENNVTEVEVVMPEIEVE